MANVEGVAIELVALAIHPPYTMSEECIGQSVAGGQVRT